MGGRAKKKLKSNQDRTNKPNGGAVARVVLDNAPNLGQQLISTLLCSSRVIADIVHSACVARLAISLPLRPSSRQEVSEVLEQGKLYCCWLARHGCLLDELEVSLWHEQEEVIAAALAAAAGTASASTTTTRHRSGLVAIAAAAAADRSATISAQQQNQQQGLPLRHLKCLTPINGPLLCSLHGSSHLSTLELAVSSQSPSKQLSAALAGLKSLRQLTLIKGEDINTTTSSSRRMEWYRQRRPLVLEPVLVKGLQQLTQITQLQLRSVEMPPTLGQYLPVSIIELAVGCRGRKLPNLSNLTGLQRLHLPFLIDSDDGASLPPHVTELHLDMRNFVAHSVQQLPQLQQLKVLHISKRAALAPEQLQLLASMTQLEQLLLDLQYESRVTVLHHDSDNERGLWMAEIHFRDSAKYLPALPLKQLHLSRFFICREVVAVLGQCTQLTSLSIRNEAVQATPYQLAEQLQMLTGLQVLELSVLDFRPHYPFFPLNIDEPIYLGPDPSGSDTDSEEEDPLGWGSDTDPDASWDVGPLMDAIQQMKSLTTVTVRDVEPLSGSSDVSSEG